MPIPQGRSRFRAGGPMPWSGAEGGDSPWRRWLWPPNVVVVIVAALLASIVLGFCGAVVYTRTSTGALEPRDPSEEPSAPTVTSEGSGAEVTTTTEPDLSPDALARKLAPSVWSINTLDDAGRPVEGSGFVAGAFGGQTFLVTSLAVVRAATRVPGPVISVRGGGSEMQGTLWTWHEERDLALVVVPRTAPALKWADALPDGRSGMRVWAAAGGGAVTPGTVSGSSVAAIPHDVATEDRRQGGPLVNGKGEVLGVLSRDYSPGGTPTDRVYFAVPIRLTCERVLRCGGGNASPEPRRQGTTTTR